MRATVRIHLLGEFHILNDGVMVDTVLSARLQALMACLILQRGKALSRQHIAFLLWPDSSEGQARTNLRHLLHTLRHSLPAADHFLHVDSLTLEWASFPLSSDIAEFEEEVAKHNLERAV